VVLKPGVLKTDGFPYMEPSTTEMPMLPAGEGANRDECLVVAGQLGSAIYRCQLVDELE